jgi:hypothetical protein
MSHHTTHTPIESDAVFLASCATPAIYAWSSAVYSISLHNAVISSGSLILYYLLMLSSGLVELSSS